MDTTTGLNQKSPGKITNAKMFAVQNNLRQDEEHNVPLN